MTVDEVLKFAPLVLGVVSSAVRRLPAIATAARGRHEVPSGVGSGIRVAACHSKPPWSASLDRRLRGEADTSTVRRLSFALAGSGALFTVLVYSRYLSAVRDLHLPVWSVAVATALVIGFLSSAVRMLWSLRVNETQYTAAVEQAGSLIVRGVHEEVLQYSLGALRNVGAQIVSIDRAGHQIHAATGLRVISSFYLGEYMAVTIDELGEKTAEIRVRSLKLDYVTPSRSRSNVANFLECWAFYPAKD